MNFDPGDLVSFFEGRIGRKATIILSWLLFVVVLVGVVEFLIDHAVLPLERFFGGTGDIRADLISESGAPFWPAIVATLTILSASVLLFIPFINLLIGGRRVPQSVLDQLEEKRSWAIHNVLNYKVSSEDDMKNWHQNNDKFVNEVKEILEKHCSRADVLRFSRLGVIWNVTFDFATVPEHARQLRMFAKRLDTLEKIVDRYSLR